MSPDQAATISAEMSAQRSQELAGNEAHYRLRKACAVRAVDLYEALNTARHELGAAYQVIPQIDQLLKEIEHAAQ